MLLPGETKIREYYKSIGRRGNKNNYAKLWSHNLSRPEIVIVRRRNENEQSTRLAGREKKTALDWVKRSSTQEDREMNERVTVVWEWV